MSTRTPRQRAAALRKRAVVRGLRVTRRGEIITLHSGDTVLYTGSPDDVEQWFAERYPRLPGGPTPALTAPPAWAAMISDYLVNLRAAGQPETTVGLRRFQLARLATDLGVAPGDITADMLIAWLGSHPAWKAETRRSYRATMRGFFRWAYLTKRLPEHLADVLPQVQEKRGAPRPAPDHAWQAALAAADGRTTVMLRLAAEAGLRRGEVAQAHSRDLLEGINGAQLLVHGKGGKQRVVPINDSLAALVRRGAAGHTPEAPTDGWLFPNDCGGHLSAHYVGTLVAAVLPDGWTMHTLRHRFASRAYRGTRNLRAVQQLLGHASIATTERYTAVDDDEIRAAMMAASL